MQFQKIKKMTLAAASLAMFAGSAHAIPENPLGDLTAWLSELPYDVVDEWFTGGDDGSAHRDAPSDGEAEVIGGGAETDERPNSSMGG